MAFRNKKLELKAGAFAFRLLERGFLKRSHESAARYGAKAAMLAYRIDKKHRKRAAENLRLAFPEWPEEKVQETVKEVYRHFGRVAADFMRAEIRDPQEVLDSVIVEGREHYDAAAALGKGVMGITGHFGNWERMGHFCTLLGIPLTVVARDADDSAINLGMAKKRAAQGFEVLSRGNTVRHILSRLRDGHLVGILPDQNSNDAMVPFFGIPAGTTLGPAVLHKRTGAPLVPLYFAHLPDGKYLFRIYPMRIYEDPETPPEEIMADLNQVLESMIRDFPSQWLWLHDRWKRARRLGLI
jgi:KDO2-lipid IV(A) lauroyltransferase